MSQYSIVCKYNQYGYCKYGLLCFKKHVDKICENDNCSIKGCNLRHPRKCKYFMHYNYCKFGQYCRFKHIESDTNNEINNLKKQILEKDALIKEKEDMIQVLRVEISGVEKECSALRDEIAVADMIFESFKERMRDKYLYDSNDEESEYEPDDELREMNRVKFRKRKEEYRCKQKKCDVCSFASMSEKGLRTHMTRKHKE